MTRLPVEAVVDDLRRALSGPGVAVLCAEPGAGKTTVVPLRLLDAPWLGTGGILVLEPRRVAARAAARRMAEILGEPVGDRVGYSTRDERRVGPSTRIEVVTDGILTRRIQRDPELTGVGIVIFDEFHERHLQADFGLALTLDIRGALRPDLRVLVMSATIDTAAVAHLLGDAPIVQSAGRTFPVEQRWSPVAPNAHLDRSVAATVHESVRRDRGDLLVFLPGVGEIAAARRAIGTIDGIDLCELHGSLPGAEQDRVLRGGDRRRVVLSTDLAESSVTVDGVGVVVDAGLVRRPQYDPSTGLSRLRTMPSSRASADQRSGRAGRTAPGVAYRLWSEGEHLGRRAWPDPEITVADLAPLALDLAIWGASSTALQWLDAPPTAALATAVELLVELGAIDDGRPTALGRALADLPLHPRLARMIISAPPESRPMAAAMAALISERDVVGRERGSMPIGVDIAERLALIDRRGNHAGRDRAALELVRRRAGELLRRAGSMPTAHDRAPSGVAPQPGPILALGFPDRIAQHRGGTRYRLRHGSGAALPDHDPLGASAWLVVADVEGGGAIGRADGRIRLAAAIDADDVEEIGRGGIESRVAVAWDDQIDDLRTTATRSLDALVLGSERRATLPGPEAAAALTAHAAATKLRDLGWSAASRALQSRVEWARRMLGDEWPDVSDEALAESAEQWLLPLLGRAKAKADLSRVDPGQAIRSLLGGRVGELERLLPAAIELSGGKRATVEYRDDRPRISVRTQDVYGSRVHPTVGGGRIPVTVELLSPAGRPIQVTADLPGFWSGSWRQVRREMAIRYPKHFWPEDPLTESPGAGRGRRKGA